MSACILWTKRKIQASKESLCVHTCSHTEHVFFLCVLSAVSDLFLPHQIFSVKTDIWNWEIHSTAPRCTLKRSAFTKGDCATSRVRRKTEFLLNRLVGCAIDACFVLTWFGRSLPRCCAELSCLSSVLKCSTGCCNLFSVWPDYCLLHIVWWRAAGWRDGRRRG